MVRIEARLRKSKTCLIMALPGRPGPLPWSRIMEFGKRSYKSWRPRHRAPTDNSILSDLRIRWRTAITVALPCNRDTLMSFLELIRPRKSLSALQAPEPLLLLKMFSYHMARVRLGIKIRVAFAAAAGLGSLFFRKWTRRNAGWIVSHFFVRLEMISQGLFVV